MLMRKKKKSKKRPKKGQKKPKRKRTGATCRKETKGKERKPRRIVLYPSFVHLMAETSHIQRAKEPKSR